jgi:hypothetical protein
MGTVDEQYGGVVRGHSAGDELRRVGRGVAGEPELELGPGGGSPPRRQRGAPQLGREHALHPSLRPGHELQHDVGDCPRAGEEPGLWFRRAGSVL